jgi:transposase
MYFTGIDVHKKTSFLTTIDERGQVVSRGNLSNDPEAILGYFKALDVRSKIVIESTASWFWLYDLLTENGHDVVVSNPLKTKAIASAKIKNDKLDSYMLAQLLRADLIATVYVSPLQIRKLKELTRHRQKLVRDASRMKNRIHSILAKNNCQSPYSDLFGVKGLKYLEQIKLPKHHRAQLESFLLIYQHLEKLIAPLTDQIYTLAKSCPTAKLLTTIPGIGPITAMFVMAEIGDIDRFASYRKLASYAGLVPSLKASGETAHMGSITKQGSVYLRTALIEAAQAAARMKHGRISLFFRRRIVKSGYRKAIVATAHKLLQYVYFVLKNQTPYCETYPRAA